MSNFRRAARIDGNANDIIIRLRQIGATVCVTAAGERPPFDALIGFRGLNWAMEFKNPKQPPSKRRLSEAEALFHRTWRGQVDTILTFQDALDLITGVE